MITGGPTDPATTTSTGNTGSSLVQGLLGALGIGATAFGGGALTQDAYQRLGEIGQQAVLGTTVTDETGASQYIPGAAQIAAESLGLSQFRPFTVTTATGGQFGVTPQVDPNTGVVTGLGTTMGLSPAEQQLQQTLMGQAATGIGATPFGQQMGQQAATSAFGLGGQFMGAAAQQPSDLNLLRGMFTQRAAGGLGGGQMGQLGQLPQNYIPSPSGPTIPAGFTATMSTGNSTFYRNPQTGESFTISGQMSGSPTMSEIRPAPEGYQPQEMPFSGLQGLTAKGMSPDMLMVTSPTGQQMPVSRQDPRLQGLSDDQIRAKLADPRAYQQAPTIGQFGQQALGMGAAGLGGAGVPDVSGAFTGITAPGLRDVSQAYSGIQAPGVRTAAGQLAARGLGLGMAGLETQAPSDVEALRQQYTQLASQTAGRALQDTAGREADVYERIRATQRPEEERQRLALEERMAQQGRLGVRTAMYGGTPEQAALAMQQEEAQNRASLAAIQQAQAERQQAVSEAQTFGGLFGQQAGLSSQLQSAAQQRATQLSQLGLSAEQMQAQLEQEGFGRQMQLGQAGMQAQQAQAQLEAQRLGQQLQLGQAGIGAAQAQSALQTQAQQRAAQLSQLGLSAQQIESQLQSEGLGRAVTSASQAAQLAQVAGGLQAQQAGLGAQYASLGSQLAMQNLAAQQAQQQLGLGALTGAYMPQAQLLNAMQAQQLYPQLQQQAQLFGTGQYGETMMSGLEARLIAEQARANLLGGIGSGLLGGLFSPIATAGGGVGSLFGSILGDIFDGGG